MRGRVEYATEEIESIACVSVSWQSIRRNEPSSESWARVNRNVPLHGKVPNTRLLYWSKSAVGIFARRHAIFSHVARFPATRVALEPNVIQQFNEVLWACWWGGAEARRPGSGTGQFPCRFAAG